MKFNRNFYIVMLVLIIGGLLLTGCSEDEATKDKDLTLIEESYDFSDADSGWYSGYSDTSRKKYTENNTYQIEVFEGDIVSRAPAPISKLSPEYVIKADVEHVTMEGHSGLVFNHFEDGDLDDYYLFRVDPYSGEYKISRYNEITGDGWSHLTDWKKCYLNMTEPNMLKVKQDHDKVTFYLNGKTIDQLTGIAVHQEGVWVGIFTSSLNATTEEGSDTLLDPVVSEFHNFEVSGYAAE